MIWVLFWLAMPACLGVVCYDLWRGKARLASYALVVQWWLFAVVGIAAYLLNRF